MEEELRWWGWNFELNKWFPCLDYEARECVTDEGVIVCSTLSNRDHRRAEIVERVIDAIESHEY